MPDEVRQLDQTLATVEARAQELEKRAADLETRSAATEILRAELDLVRERLEERESVFRRQEKELEKSRKGAMREVLLEARAEVERAVALADQNKAREARRVIEDSIRALAEAELRPEQSRAAPSAKRAVTSAEREAPAMVAAGQRVRIESLGIEGDVESIQGNDVAVLVRGRRVRVATTDVTALR